MSSSDKLREVLARLARESRAAATLTQDGHVFDAVDSITKLEAVLAIESAFGIELSEAELLKVRTFAELAQIVERKSIAVDAKEVPATTAAATVSAQPLPKVPEAPWSGPAAACVAVLMRVWFRITVRGAPYVPKSEACLLCANHSSHLDSLLLLASAGGWRHRLVFAAAKDYFFSRARIARFTARALPMIPWERTGDVAAMRENLRQLAACREAGRIVVFFPEGSRSPNGELQTFKDGLAFFASRVDLPVLPCWIEGTHRSLRKGAWFPRPGRLRIQFGELLRLQNDESAFAGRVCSKLMELRDPPA